MAVLAIPLIEGAGALLAEAFPALLGGTAVAGRVAQWERMPSSAVAPTLSKIRPVTPAYQWRI